MEVNWIKYQSGDWCNLETLDLNQEHFDNLSGVYVIWKGGRSKQVIYVGRGTIRERLNNHRKDIRITRFGISTLYVTWAQVQSVYQQGVEYFLGSMLSPEVGEHYPITHPITVNFPF